MSGNAGGLKGSMQHRLAVYPPEFQIPTFFVAVDSGAERSRPGPTASNRTDPPSSAFQRGYFYLNMKEGKGERFEEKPGPQYPGGVEAQKRLQGKRFYAYYQREELLALLQDFELLYEQKLIPGDGGFEFWVRK